MFCVIINSFLFLIAKGKCGLLIAFVVLIFKLIFYKNNLFYMQMKTYKMLQFAIKKTILLKLIIRYF